MSELRVPSWSCLQIMIVQSHASHLFFLGTTVAGYSETTKTFPRFGGTCMLRLLQALTARLRVQLNGFRLDVVPAALLRRMRAMIIDYMNGISESVSPVLTFLPSPYTLFIYYIISKVRNFCYFTW